MVVTYLSWSHNHFVMIWLLFLKKLPFYFLSKFIWILAVLFTENHSLPDILTLAFLPLLLSMHWLLHSFTILGPYIILHSWLEAVISNLKVLSISSDPMRSSGLFLEVQLDREGSESHPDTDHTVQAPHLPLCLFPIQLEMNPFFPLPEVKPLYVLPRFLQSYYCLFSFSLHTTTHQTHHWQRNFTKWDCIKNTTMLRKIQIYSSPSPTKYSFGIRSTVNGCQLSNKPYSVGNHIICCSYTGKYMFGVKGVLLTMGRIRTYGHELSLWLS